MGSVLIETMVRPDSEILQPKKVHPFFTKAPQDAPSLQVPPSHDVVNEDTASTGSYDTPSSAKKRRQGDDSTPIDEQAPKKQRQRKATRKSTEGSIVAHLSKPPSSEATAANDIPTPPLSDNTSSVVDSVNIPAIAPAQPYETSTKQPTKLLKFDPKTGTFGLPPKPKDEKPTRIITIKYGHDDAHREELGNMIAGILSEKPSGKRRGRKPRSSAQIDEAGKAETKPLQSFFTSKGPKKAKETESPAPTGTPRNKSPPPRRHTIFMSTPVSPRKNRTPFPNTKPPIQWGSMKPIGTKVPGAMHPDWPCQDTTHVRGDDVVQISVVPSPGYDGWIPRKYKGQMTSLTMEDSVLNGVTQRLDLLSIRETLYRHDRQIDAAPEELRKPTRLFEAGRKLRKRITKELHTNVAAAFGGSESGDELQDVEADKVHPAILRHYRDLETSLSAFDCSSCEGSTWAQKYAPVTAGQILQSGKEASLLKDWLKALQIQSVDKGTADSAKAKGKSEKLPKKKRKKKRKKKLDDFIVESDETDDMEEISEDEEDWIPAGPGSQRKSVVRRLIVKDPSRLANTMIVSGPHGCGKTAAVHAIAKELDFEIFEINSGNRRSGKDILEKVGDMTRNHLVQHHQTETTTTEPEAEDEVANDLKSGKQGMMTAFFKPNPAQVPKKPSAVPKKKESAVSEDKKPSSKTQRQSLILVEEADVLYEEDKQFWATLMTLMAQSRRPFILTCNDENLVPIQSLHLHGILRFSTPPSNLAVDACLLIAANEGHALQRSAVEALYVSRGHDLRATITELNYWCQIGVGDRRGGFDWFLPRWPKGSDRDEYGDIVRVISQGTYTKGMGWLGRDLLCTSSSLLGVEEEAMRQCWDSWRTLVGDWSSSLHLSSCTMSPAEASPAQEQFISLEAYQQLSESLSDADLLSGGALCTATYQDLIDTTLPDLPSKVKDDYTLGQQLLEATILTDTTHLSANLSLSVLSLARQEMLHDASRHSNEKACSVLSPVGEDKATSILEASFRNTAPEGITRRDLAFAFDPIAASEGSAVLSSLEPSVFDRTKRIIVNDVAPWVRSIVAYDQSLMLERRKLSNLLSEGGQPRKRMRNTRSAYSALEGGERKTTRRDNYFRGVVNTKAILDTGLKAWRDAARELDSTITTTEEEGGPRNGTSPVDSGSPEDTGSGGSP